jgi:hypothetical protein
MREDTDGWPTVQQTAAMLYTTSAEVCRLLNIGRFRGKKYKQPGRPGGAQWLVDPKSIAKEKRRHAERWKLTLREKRRAGFQD